MGIENQPRIWCEHGWERKVARLFALMDELLGEEEERERAKLQLANAVEEAKWKEQEEEFQALLKEDGQTEEEVRQGMRRFMEELMRKDD